MGSRSPGGAALLILVLLLTACPRQVPEAVGDPHAAQTPYTELDALYDVAARLEGARLESRCELKLDQVDGALLGRLEETSSLRVEADGAFSATVVRRYDNRYQRDGLDSFDARFVGRALFARRQQEGFARLTNLHGEAARYREMGAGSVPALIRALSPSVTRRGDELRLSPGARDERGLVPPRLTEGAWDETWRFFTRGGEIQGVLTWPQGRALPSGGELSATARVNEHGFTASCAFTVHPTAGDPPIKAPEAPVQLERPLEVRNLRALLRAVEEAGAGSGAAPR
jgi:hypothetical protein